MKRRSLWTMLVVLTIALAGCGDDTTDPAGNNGGTTDNGTNNSTIDAAVEASDQTLADATTLTVDRVRSAGPGWVVIYDNGAVLGQTSVPEGEFTDVEVTLDEPLEEGDHPLRAVLHTDAEPLGEFAFPGDDAPVLDDGNLFAADFTVTVPDLGPDPSITANDQTLLADQADTVTIAEVVSDGPGWVVITDAACEANTAGQIIGHAAVDDGENSGVTVTLDAPAAHGDTYCAKLFADAAPVDTFGNEDLAVEVDGSIVMQSFTISVPSITANDQTLPAGQADTITVASAVSDGPGWIVLHNGECTMFPTPGTIIGHAGVDDGENTDIDVSLDSGSFTDGQKVCAMLYTDEGTVGDFEAGNQGADQPVFPGGTNFVMDTVNVTVQ